MHLKLGDFSGTNQTKKGDKQLNYDLKNPSSFMSAHDAKRTNKEIQSIKRTINLINYSWKRFLSFGIMCYSYVRNDFLSIQS